MITEHDLQEAIAECEGQRNPTSSTCMKLAAFYTIRDKMYPEPKGADPEPAREPMHYSTASGPASWDGEVDYSSDTEFGRAISRMSMDRVFSIMDELMSTLQVVSPRIYSGVMRQLAD